MWLVSPLFCRFRSPHNVSRLSAWAESRTVDLWCMPAGLNKSGTTPRLEHQADKNVEKFCVMKLVVHCRPHEFVSDAHKRNFEKNLGEDVREIVFTFDVAWNRNRSVTDGLYP